MPTGTKIAAIVLVVLLGAAGLYYAVVAPPASNSKSATAKESGAATGGTAVNGLSSQTPGTLAPAVPSVGAQPSPASATPAVGALGANGISGSPTPVPTGLPAGTGTAGAREQPGFTPGSLTSGGTGKGDLPASARPAPAPAPGTVINGIPVSGGNPTTPPTVGAVPASGTAPMVTPLGGPRPTSPTPVGVVPNGGVNTGGGGIGPAPLTPNLATSRGETTHTVASGETMSSIAKKYLGSENAWRTIAKANPAVDPTAMKIGTKIRIPSGDEADSKPAVRTTAGGTTGGTAGTGASSTATASSGESTHVVSSGDTLASIARKYYGNTKHWERIYSENKGLIGSDPAALKIGQKLKIPAKSAVVGR
jgi:nucleoid-associated protein YgaU